MNDANLKILVVDDEHEIRNMLNIFLSVEDFDIIEASTGKEAIRFAIQHKPDLILLDLGLPDMDGTDVIKSIRQLSQTPIIVLTARAEDDQAVPSLNLGADDYVTKPFRAEVLLARINANLRAKMPAMAKNETICNGPIKIDNGRHEIHIYDKLVAFTPKEYDLLHLFVTNKGRIITHKQILKDVWGPAHVDDTQYLRVYIGQVREKMVSAGIDPAVIVSESGIGYRMEAIIAPILAAAE
jgi:two-component system KDP operon response regulator KdpE